MFFPIRFEYEKYRMVADNRGSIRGYGVGHYDATLGRDGNSKAYFRVHAPNPEDFLR